MATAWTGVMVGGLGCASDPTVVNVMVAADTAVPALSVLRVTLTQAASPPRVRSDLFRSLRADTDGGAEPFAFPAIVPFNFPAASDGAAEVRVEGLDYTENYRLVAAGVSTTTVKKEGTVTADVWLSLISADGATPLEGSTDGGMLQDDASDAEAGP